MTSVHFEKVALIGIGLIGSSLARAMRENKLADTLVACARKEETRKTALDLGIVDEAFENPADAVRDADLVILCTPVSTYGPLAETFGKHLKAGAIVTDVGSVKQSVVNDVKPHLPDSVDFVPGHPIAGTEQSGPEAGFASLFVNRWCILTPTAEASDTALNRIRSLWEACGSMVEIMTPERHDKVLAVTSHLPHLIAYTIVGTATDLEEDDQADVIKFSASGFRDFTRIAASDPVMWRDVFLTNRDAVLEILQRFTEDLTALQRAIRRSEGDTLQDLFTRTREIRRGIVDAHQAGTFDPREPEVIEETTDKDVS
ncbi:prephenate/arogenate dehydrogenase family protein [Kiloniella sp. b19]|uniref:prephenate/arogenate dehydrogenase family protein n=1 Tax=Kiloniella sp. GXU_MW_B19 TaxID=3141326 RepID=UPI0031DD16E9